MDRIKVRSLARLGRTTVVNQDGRLISGARRFRLEAYAMRNRLQEQDGVLDDIFLASTITFPPSILFSQ